MNEFTTTDGRFTVLYDDPKTEISTRFRDGKNPLLAEAYPNLAAMIDAQFDDEVTVESLEISELTEVIESLGFDDHDSQILAADTLTTLA